MILITQQTDVVGNCLSMHGNVLGNCNYNHILVAKYIAEPELFALLSGTHILSCYMYRFIYMTTSKFLVLVKWVV